MIRVMLERSGLEHLGSHSLGQKLFQRHHLRRCPGAVTDVGFVKTGRMRQQLGDRNRIGVVALNSEAAHVLGHVVLQVDRTALSQLHDRRCGERLGYRGNAKQCLVRINKNLLPNISVSVSFGDYRLTILDDHYDHARDVELVEASGDEWIEERLEHLPIDQ